VEHPTIEEWNRVMAINAAGVFLGTKAVIPAMRHAGGGSIINISSQLGLVGTDNSSPQYQASKGAVRLRPHVDRTRRTIATFWPISALLLACSMSRTLTRILRLSRLTS
jgi:NAD(P)-dependent dehydrogenase (short-subunit alcohol dehydrogenase family)